MKKQLFYFQLNNFKSLISSVCILLFGLQAISQDINTNSKNIYEYGTSIDSYESNFKNLWNNWNSNTIENPDSLVLLNYCHLETLTNQSLIDKYIDSMVAGEAVLSRVGYSSSSGSNQISKKSTILQVFTWKSITEGANKDDVEKERDQLKKAIRRGLNIGDVVYSVLLRTNKGVYTNFVICNPKTKKVVWDNLFINLKYK